MSSGRVLKLVTGTAEAFLGIPFVGGMMHTGFMHIPLMVMLILHIITLVYCNQDNLDKAPSTLGIMTSCLGWIPYIGAMLHLLTGAFLLVSAAKEHGSVHV